MVRRPTNSQQVDGEGWCLGRIRYAFDAKVKGDKYSLEAQGVFTSFCLSPGGQGAFGEIPVKDPKTGEPLQLSDYPNPRKLVWEANDIARQTYQDDTKWYFMSPDGRFMFTQAALEYWYFLGPCSCYPSNSQNTVSLSEEFPAPTDHNGRHTVDGAGILLVKGRNMLKDFSDANGSTARTGLGCCED